MKVTNRWSCLYLPRSLTYLAHGALVTACWLLAVPGTPLGNAVGGGGPVSGTPPRGSDGVELPPAHGALEYGIPGPVAAPPGMPVACAHGAAVPAPAGGCPPGTPVVGWLARWTECTGAWAAGSLSHEKSEPKGKCWTTGNLESTSALNIFIMPLLILPHPSRMPEMSKRMGLCSQKGPFLTSLMKATAEK
jgi:hypothetical protein